MAALLVAAALGSCTERRDLTAHHDPAGRLCEISVGMERHALPIAGRRILRYPEGMAEERLIVPLCGGDFEAELAFDEEGRVGRIILAEPGMCLQSICVGDRHGDVAGRPGLRSFFFPEEGGIVALSRPEAGISYAFLVDVPSACLQGPVPCPEISRLRLETIIVGRPEGQAQ